MAGTAHVGPADGTQVPRNVVLPAVLVAALDRLRRRSTSPLPTAAVEDDLHLRPPAEEAAHEVEPLAVVLRDHEEEWWAHALSSLTRSRPVPTHELADLQDARTLRVRPKIVMIHATSGCRRPDCARAPRAHAPGTARGLRAPSGTGATRLPGSPAPGRLRTSPGTLHP